MICMELLRIGGVKSDVKLMPDVSWGDMYNYLVNSPSEHSGQPETLQITGSFQLFCVQPCSRYLI